MDSLRGNRLLFLSAAFLLAGFASAPAAAEPKLDATATSPAAQAPPEPVTCATMAVFPIDGDLECLPSPPIVDPPRDSRFEHLPVRGGVGGDAAATPSYGALLEELVITRDLELPGFPGLGVRMIPSRSALAGRSSPVVVVPRFVGTSWYGAEIVARF